jgi:hypothetical protein
MAVNAVHGFLVYPLSIKTVAGPPKSIKNQINCLINFIDHIFIEISVHSLLVTSVGILPDEIW